MKVLLGLNGNENSLDVLSRTIERTIEADQVIFPAATGRDSDTARVEGGRIGPV